jgi:pimeloyl-ACP methyl ester carboxylesterase
VAVPAQRDLHAVHLWHGTLDRNAPIAYARRLARELPDATLHVSESGHDVGLDRSVSEPHPVPEARELFPDDFATNPSFLCFLFFVLQAD